MNTSQSKETLKKNPLQRKSSPPEKRAYTFGVITSVAKDIFRSHYHREIVAGLFDQIGRGNHELKFHIFQKDSYQNLDDLFKKYSGLDGLFLIAWRWLHPDLVRLIQKSLGDTPTIVFNDFEPELKIGVLYTDVCQGMKDMVCHLSGKGYARLAAICGPSHISFRKTNGKAAEKVPFVDAQEKVRGFKEALKECGSSIKKSWLLRCSAYNSNEGYCLTKKLLGEKQKPDVIICANDDLAFGALQAIAEKELSVPEDIAVTGFDDTEKASLVTPKLTTVAQPLYKMGQDAVHFLIEKIEDSSLRPVQKCYPTKLVIRESA